ncbi:MAG: sulfotransferase domain-containing protein [Myxococcales bacterium]|nr:sulfotransferase domain-containing protein [Myxococcales bacterium]
MTTNDIQWPRKTRELHNHHCDSTIWNDFPFRSDDIIVATYAKSGTTWMQQIISQLLFDATPDLEVAEMSPWLDLRVPPREVKLPAVEAQEHRRFLKTHLPLDALVYSPEAKYLYIARDGRDIVWSFYNHHANANDLWYELINDTPGRVGPPIDKPRENVREYFLEWLDRDGYPLWSFWENVRTWWNARDLPNLELLHYADLKADLRGRIEHIAKFLGIDVPAENWDRILLHCSFDYMKQNATKSTPLGGICWDGGAQVFVNKGVNGRWRDVLTAEDNARYEARAVEELGEDCARWLATGER